MTSPASLAIALRHQADGVYRLEAADELLITTQTWLHRTDFTSRFLTLDRGLIDGRPLASIDWPACRRTTSRAGGGTTSLVGATRSSTAPVGAAPWPELVPGLERVLRVTPHGNAATLLLNRTGTEIPLLVATFR
jgi:hypothetical protein